MVRALIMHVGWAPNLRMHLKESVKTFIQYPNHFRSLHPNLGKFLFGDEAVLVLVEHLERGVHLAQQFILVCVLIIIPNTIFS